jgi:hypothetical protein
MHTLVHQKPTMLFDDFQNIVWVLIHWYWSIVVLSIGCPGDNPATSEFTTHDRGPNLYHFYIIRSVRKQVGKMLFFILSLKCF